MLYVAWVVLHRNRHIGTSERRQRVIPHVRFQVPFLGPESQLKSGFACACLLCSIFLKQGGGVFRLAECLKDSCCSSTIIFPHTRPHVSTNLISRFLLSALAAEAWRSKLGVLCAKFRGLVVWFTLNTVVVVHLKHWCGSP